VYGGKQDVQLGGGCPVVNFFTSEIEGSWDSGITLVGDEYRLVTSNFLYFCKAYQVKDILIELIMTCQNSFIKNHKLDAH